MRITVRFQVFKKGKIVDSFVLSGAYMFGSDGTSLRGFIEGGDDEKAYVVTEWLSDLETKPSHMVLKNGWKLMLPNPSETKVVKALYNLNEDPHELNNLLADKTAADDYDSKAKELESCFQEWTSRTSNGH